ncbi:MAG: hypothetical protein FWG36_04840 [Oscillospiraceae bacterium]|nr:hypothetical protein [Oscillospiraceae bacterium]
MYNVNLEEFWQKDETAHDDNCFSPNAKQVAMGIRMSHECLFAELGEEGNPWGHTPPEQLNEMSKRYNDKAEKIVGKRLLREDTPPEIENFPEVRGIGEVFGGRYEFNGVTTWLFEGLHTPQELEKQLDWVDKLDLREFILPENWESEKKRLFEDYGKKPPLWRHVRGPVTLAMSVYGAENLIYLILDEPELAERFSASIAKVIRGYIDIMDTEAGHTPETRPSGFSFADDDCCLLNPDMYELFGYRVLKSIFDYISPNPDDSRYQHSDSAMGHLLPILARLNLTGCNFGPTVMIDEIRQHMPKTRIDGQLHPMTFMRNDEEAIIAEVKRDCELAKRCGRGLNLSCAGSINNGSLLTSMRAVMYAIQEYGQY